MSAEELNERIQELAARVELIADPGDRRIAEEFAAAIVEMHGEGLAALMAALDDETRRRVADDGMVGSLLLIHGLHPVPIEERVLEGLAEVRPYMESHGGDVELIGVFEGVARLRLTGSCDGCAASSSTLELAVEKALQSAAPDLLGMDVEGAVAGVQLPMAGNGHAPHSLVDWVSVDGIADLLPGELRAVVVGSERLVVANVDGNVLAYRDTCAACSSSLANGTLSDGLLACPSCGRGWFLPRAGRSLDDERLQLEPVPLLVERGAGVKVALPS